MLRLKFSGGHFDEAQCKIILTKPEGLELDEMMKRPIFAIIFYFDLIT